MIVNPVRYAKSGTKTVDVTITLTSASYIELYCTQNGKFLNYYHSSSNEASEFTVTVDAGSCFVVRIGESYIDFFHVNKLQNNGCVQSERQIPYRRPKSSRRLTPKEVAA